MNFEYWQVPSENSGCSLFLGKTKRWKLNRDEFNVQGELLSDLHIFLFFTLMILSHLQGFNNKFLSQQIKWQIKVPHRVSQKLFHMSKINFIFGCSITFENFSCSFGIPDVRGLPYKLPSRPKCFTFQPFSPISQYLRYRKRNFSICNRLIKTKLDTLELKYSKIFYKSWR